MKKMVKKFFVCILSLALVLPSFSLPVYASYPWGSDPWGSGFWGSGGTGSSSDAEDAELATSGRFGKSNGFRWRFDEDDCSLTVSGEDEGIDELPACLPNIILSNTEEIIFQNCVVTGGSMSYMFGAFRDSLTSVDMSDLDTSGVTDMAYMFYWCSSLKSIDVSGLDTSNVTNMSNMFSWCENLESVDMNGLDTSNVTDMSNMFSWCENLESVDMSGLDLSGVTKDISDIFYGCDNLESIATPKAMAPGVGIKLPDGFITSKITSAYCNETLAKEYQITYHLDNGKNAAGNPPSYNKLSANIVLKAPTKTGYTFEGWYSDSSYTKPVTTIKKGSTGKKEFYAKWTLNKYNIAFDGNKSTSGSVASLKSCKYGKSYTLNKNTFKRSGYTFKGWNTKADGSGTAYKDKESVKNLSSKNGTTVILYAQWEPVKYSITYKLDGGNNNSKNPKYYTREDKTFVLQTPTKTGYTFKGWYSDKKCTKKVTQITKGSSGDKVFYAKWEAAKYTIKYNLNGGKNSSKNPTSYKITTSTIKLQNPSRNGYTFKGWYSDSSYTKQVTTIKKGSSGNKTLYAKWEAVKYSITYKLNGGKNNAANPESYSATTATIALKNPSREGYIFKGWYSDKKCTKKVINIKKGSSGNKTFYAKWEAQKYTIKYNLNGGKNNSKNPSNYTFATSNIKLQNPSRDGYTFKGWYSDSKFTKKVKTITKGSTGNKTFYAKWEAENYTIKYNLNGGKNNSKNPTSYKVTTSTIKLQNPTRKGYVFKGWYSDKKCTKKVTQITKGSTGNKTFYAKWAKK